MKLKAAVAFRVERQLRGAARVPETYAMMLAGLGAIGNVARRRKFR